VLQTLPQRFEFSPLDGKDAVSFEILDFGMRELDGVHDFLPGERYCCDGLPGNTAFGSALLRQP